MGTLLAALSWGLTPFDFLSHHLTVWPWWFQ